MWQPNWNENQTVLGTVIYTPDKYAGILEITVVGSWSLGSNPRLRAAVDCRETD